MKDKKKDDALFRGENLFELVFGFLGFLILWFGKFIMKVGTVAIGVVLAVIGLGIILVCPPLGTAFIVPLVYIIIKKAENRNRKK